MLLTCNTLKEKTKLNYCTAGNQCPTVYMMYIYNPAPLSVMYIFWGIPDICMKCAY